MHPCVERSRSRSRDESLSSAMQSNSPMSARISSIVKAGILANLRVVGKLRIRKRIYRGEWRLPSIELTVIKKRLG